jgi:hypothetical protein
MTAQTQEPLMTVADAVAALRQQRPDLPDLPDLDIRVLQQLGKDCVLYSRIKGLPIQDVPVYGKRWPTEKAYTFAALREAFRLNPATRDFVPQEVQ